MEAQYYATLALLGCVFLLGFEIGFYIGSETKR